jgi:hypothetical protein
MKSKELLKFNDRQSLVVRTREDGTVHEYVVCSNYNDTAPEGSKWDWGHYFSTMEDALKYIATRCFTPMYRYVLVEADTNTKIEEKTYNTYDEARKEFDKRFNNYKSDENCCHAEVVDDGNGNTVGELWYSSESFTEDVTLKIIEVVV